MITSDQIDHESTMLSIDCFRRTRVDLDQAMLMWQLLNQLQPWFGTSTLSEIVVQLEINSFLIENFTNGDQLHQFPRETAVDCLRSQGWNISWYQTDDDQGFEIDGGCEKLCEWKITNL
jgi:hypothetical protein